MRGLWLRRVAVLSAAGLVTGLLSVAGVVLPASPAFAVDDCALLGGVPGAQCVVTGTHTPAPGGGSGVGGAYVLNETLHLSAGAVLDARVVSSPSLFKIAITVGDLLMDEGSQILTTDALNGTPNDPAGSVELGVAGNVVMQPDSLIDASNVVSGGQAGNVTITAGGNMTMCGDGSSQAGPPVISPPAACGAAGSVGARILSEFRGGNATQTGVSVISINVGDQSKLTGDFFMGGSTQNGYGAETGALISATSDGGSTGGGCVTCNSGSGAVNITAGGTFRAELGSVIVSGDGNGTTTQRGGKIYIVSGCRATAEGRITSKGNDPGADLVHLEGCEVLVRGLIESTGAGHKTDEPNSCDGNNDGLPTEVRPGKPDNSTACIEVWGKTVTIDSTGGYAGELNADIGDGGVAGTSWIDVFALCCDLNIKDGTGNDHQTNNLGARGSGGEGDYFTTYAVHANSIGGSDDTPNTITLISCGTTGCTATLNGSGHVAQAASDANGSNGGTIDVEATNNINLDTAFLDAHGDLVGNTQVGGVKVCPIPSQGGGDCGTGGTISVTSFLGTISWQNGDGNVLPNNPPPQPAINLTACGGAAGINTTNTEFHGITPNPADSGCSGSPTLPSFVPVADLLARWANCGKTLFDFLGVKWEDKNGNGIRDPGDDGLGGWTMHIYGPGTANPTSVTTQNDGTFFYNSLLIGTYQICEVQQPTGTPPPTWQETFPTAATLNVAPCSGAGEAALGYQFTTTAQAGGCCGLPSTVELPISFGNHQVQVPNCPEDPSSGPKLTRTVGTGSVGGTGTPGSPIDYSTLQAAYSAAVGSGATNEVVGMFSKTSENVTMGGNKSLTITQCTNAQVTAANGSWPVIKITDTKPLTIISPDTIGGTIGWELVTGGHTLKSIRANNATVAGVRMDVGSNSNKIGWNRIDGNTIGIDSLGNSNTLTGGSLTGNTGVGVHLGGSANTLSGATIEKSGSHGVLVDGSTNQIKSDKSNSNGGDGFFNKAGSSNNYSGSTTQTNAGKEFEFGTTGVNGGSDKADGTTVPSAAKGCTSFNASQACN